MKKLKKVLKNLLTNVKTSGIMYRLSARRAARKKNFRVFEARLGQREALRSEPESIEYSRAKCSGCSKPRLGQREALRSEPESIENSRANALTFDP